VLTEEPVPPSRLNGLLPRDLETICLKCLQKNPKHRYASALALAEDLHRFQAGEAIQARPLGSVERLVRWCRRKPASACLAAFAIVIMVLLGILVSLLGNHAAPAAATPAPLKIVAFQISQHRGAKAILLGNIGSGPVRFDDDLRVQAEFNTLAHCYLIAFNADGKEQTCYPAKDTDIPEPITGMRYPPGATDYFPLNDGIGLQAFVLLASAAPLPSWQEWRRRHGQALWGRFQGDEAWRFDGRRFEQIGTTRGEVRKRLGPPEILESLCLFFKDHGGFDAIQVLGFPVQPKEELR
jgi:hypothetical protein